MNIEGKKFVVIGTSGSHDYLRDTTGDLRYWPSPVARKTPAAEPLAPEEHARLVALLASTVEVVPRSRAVDDAVGASCDGLHDEDAPSTYLCTRCFPDPDRCVLGADHDDDDDRDEKPDTE